jgi:hypothetical protein
MTRNSTMTPEMLVHAISVGSEDHVYHGGDWSDQIEELTAVIFRACQIMTAAQRAEFMASEEVADVLAWSENDDEDDD